MFWAVVNLQPMIFYCRFPSLTAISHRIHTGHTLIKWSVLYISANCFSICLRDVVWCQHAYKIVAFLSIWARSAHDSCLIQYLFVPLCIFSTVPLHLIFPLSPSTNVSWIFLRFCMRFCSLGIVTFLRVLYFTLLRGILVIRCIPFFSLTL